jgi:hypothetical protein
MDEDSLDIKTRGWSEINLMYRGYVPRMPGSIRVEAFSSTFGCRFTPDIVEQFLAMTHRRVLSLTATSYRIGPRGWSRMHSTTAAYVLERLAHKVFQSGGKIHRSLHPCYMLLSQTEKSERQ